MDGRPNIRNKAVCSNFSGVVWTRPDIKTEFTRGPGRGDTCHLSFFDETLPD